MISDLVGSAHREGVDALAEAVAVEAGLSPILCVGDDTDEFARSERHAHATADVIRRGYVAFRRVVVEQSRQRQRQGDAQDGIGGDRHRASLAVAVFASQMYRLQSTAGR